MVSSVNTNWPLNGEDLSNDTSSQFSEPSLAESTTEQDYESSSSEPRFRFGVLADIQYAPISDGYSFDGVRRYYRHSLDVARHAAQHFEESRAEIVLNLGDIIDGKCQAIPENGGDRVPERTDDNPGVSAMEDVLEALSHYQQGSIIHTYGNHELYNMDRETIGKKLQIPFFMEEGEETGTGAGDLVGYWSHEHRGVRFVVIDSYDVTKMGRCEETSAKYQQASNILACENPNYPQNENSSEGLEGDNIRFAAFNGGVGATQLRWLRETLHLARISQEKVIVVSHQPIHPGSTNPLCLLWNYKEVLMILRDFRDIIVAFFAGHDHAGGYKRDDESGIHFRTFEAVLENPHPHKTYGMVEVHDDCLIVQGYGNCASAVYDFDHLTMAPEKSYSLNNTNEHTEIQNHS